MNGLCFATCAVTHALRSATCWRNECDAEFHILKDFQNTLNYRGLSCSWPTCYHIHAVINRAFNRLNLLFVEFNLISVLKVLYVCINIDVHTFADVFKPSEFLCDGVFVVVIS